MDHCLVQVEARDGRCKRSEQMCCKIFFVAEIRIDRCYTNYSRTIKSQKYDKTFKEDTMKKVKDMVPYLGIIIIDFYLLPMAIKDTGSAMLMLLIVVPLICFLISLRYGLKKPFSILYSVIVSLLFVPSIFIYYNSSAWVYTIAYGIIALIGSAIGMLITKSKTRWFIKK